MKFNWGKFNHEYLKMAHNVDVNGMYLCIAKENPNER